MTPRTIFFLSDFGTRDVYVGVVEAVIHRVAPDARVIHLGHGIPPQDLRNASWQLWAAAPHLPDGSVVLAVIDPGVGSARHAVVVETDRRIYVAPDNGLLEATLARETVKTARALTNPAYRLDEVSNTFHGRDVFGPAAAHLSQDERPERFGDEVESLATLGVLPRDAGYGEIWTFDHFGNALTTMLAPSAAPDAVTVAGRRVPWAETYASVQPGEALALRGSSGLIELSVREGSAREALGLREGAEVRLV